jgi:hypothetical protein
MQAKGKGEEKDAEASDDESVKTEASTKSRSGRGRRNDAAWNHQQHAMITIDVSQRHEVVHKQTASGNPKPLNDVIILDTGSTIGGTFMNPDMVTGIKASRNPIEMTTNAGTKLLAMEGQVPNFGSIYYDPSLFGNIFGFAKLAEKCRITYDNDIKDAFLVHDNNGVVKFKRTDEGLYVYKPTPKFMAAVAKIKGTEPPPVENTGSRQYQDLLPDFNR